MTAFFKQKILALATDGKFAEILKGSAFSLLARILATGLTLLTNIVIARHYGAKAMGILALVNAVLLLTTILSSLGTNISVLRLIPEHLAKHSATSAYRTYCKLLMLVSMAALGIGLMLYGAAEVLANQLFHKPEMAFYLALAAPFILPKTLADLSSQAVRGLKLIQTFALLQVLPALLMLVILLLLSLQSQHPDTPVHAQLATWGMAAGIGLWIVYRAFRERLHPHDPAIVNSTRDLLSLSLPMMISASMNFFIGQSGILILGMQHSATEVGIYSVSVRLANLSTFILISINAIAAPKFSELYQRNQMDDLFHVAQKSTKLIFWTTAPVLLILVAGGTPLLRLLFGNDFAAAYLPMVILIIGQFVNAISGSTSFFMNMTGDQQLLGKIMLATALLNIGACLMLGSSHGMLGIAWAGMFSTILWNGCVLWRIKSRFGKTIGYLPLLSRWR